MDWRVNYQSAAWGATKILFGLTNNCDLDTAIPPWNKKPYELYHALIRVFQDYAGRYLHPLKHESVWDKRESLPKPPGIPDPDDPRWRNMVEWSDMQKDPEVQVIAFMGPMSSGKTTSGDYVAEAHGFKCTAFADRLKVLVQYVFLMTELQVHDSGLKETVDLRWSLSPRQILQVVGTELMRVHFGELLGQNTDLIWIQTAFCPDSKRICFTDVRFKAEAEFVRGFRNHAIVRLRRYRDSQKRNIASLHRSESESTMVEPTHTINNSTSLADLHCKIDDIVKEMLPCDE